MGWYGQFTTGNPLSGSARHGGQQGPVSLPNTVISASVPNASTPVALAIVDRADSVWVKQSRANMKFFFGTNSGGDAFAADQGINFGQIGMPAGNISGSMASSSIQLHIQPTGWTADSAATGDVVFYYKGNKK